jgi:hypothetical protein
MRPGRAPSQTGSLRRASRRRSCGRRSGRFGRGQTATSGRRRRKLRDAGRVTGEIGRDQVREAPHCLECAFDRLPLQGQPGLRLAGEHLVPRRRLGIEREHVAGIVGEAGGDLRVEPASRVLADEAHGMLLAPEQALEGGVDGDVDDPHRQRDLFALRAAKRALAIPALGEVGEEAVHGRGKADPLGQHLRDLAHGGEVRTLLPGQPRQPARDLEGANGDCTTRLGQRAEEPAEDLASRPVEDGVEMGGQRVAKDLGGDVGVGGAARMGEEAGIVGLRGRRLVNPEALGEPGRDQGAVQPVLEREAHTEVGGQAERADHLGRTDPLGTRCFGPHRPTVTGLPKATTGPSRTVTPASESALLRVLLSRSFASVLRTGLDTPPLDEARERSAAASRRLLPHECESVASPLARYVPRSVAGRCRGTAGAGATGTDVELQAGSPGPRPVIPRPIRRPSKPRAGGLASGAAVRLLHR